MNYVIGIDLDNTIINYGDSLYNLAGQRGLIDDGIRKNRVEIRNAIRCASNGEIEWQRLQAEVYGIQIDKAEPFPGVREFLQSCKKHKIPAYIISHKTKYPSVSNKKVNLQQVALSWLKKQNFLENEEIGLSKEDVFFEPTRHDKIKRIIQLGCTHFIDDLEETFLGDAFPANVGKILYASDNNKLQRPDITMMSNWQEITRLFFRNAFEMSQGELASVFSHLLREKIAMIKRIGQGRNNRIYKLVLQNKKPYVAKLSLPGDIQRNRRLQHEFSSLHFLWKNGIRNIPKPILVADEYGCAIYEYIEGEKIPSNQVSKREIDQAIVFLGELEALKKKKEALSVQPASDSCFSIEEINMSIDRGVERLRAIDQEGHFHYAMQDFLERDFLPVWKEILMWVRQRLRQADRSFLKKLSPKERILSPSDFGFHNALRLPERGEIIFLDFEYFGWDDPAKMISDFLLHPGMDLSKKLKQRFVIGAVEYADEPKHLMERVKTVYPLFGLKWCLILLNEFVPELMQRRRFAGDEKIDVAVLQKRQLEKAKQMLKKVSSEHQNFPYGI